VEGNIDGGYEILGNNMLVSSNLYMLIIVTGVLRISCSPWLLQLKTKQWQFSLLLIVALVFCWYDFFFSFCFVGYFFDMLLQVGAIYGNKVFVLSCHFGSSCKAPL
jgi:hypothetical protein